MKIRTKQRSQVVDITDEVNAAINAEDGMAHITVMHTTCAVTVNEADGRIEDDIGNVLADLVPKNAGYKHDAIDGNADSHVKASIIGPSVAIPVRNGELRLGRWQRVLLVECDGPRTRDITVTTTS